MYIFNWFARSLPLFQVKTEVLDGSLRPVLLWHGMGDEFNSSSMNGVVELISNIHPNTPVHSISVFPDSELDQRLGIFGNLTQQIDQVCSQLHNLSITEFDGIGFSQGGLFLRSLVESCEGLSVNNLITFGSPHNGVSELSLCEPTDWVCKRRNQLLKRQVYNPSFQSRIVQAQYFRDLDNYQEYLDKSQFLASINNENKVTLSFRNRLTDLKGKFVMIMFCKDSTVVPKVSSWFYDFDRSDGHMLKFTETESFGKDLIGLKTLYDNDQIVFESIDDIHMRIGEEFLTKMVQEFTGGELV